MDSISMKYEFLITYESIASGAAPGYTNRDISAFLTESQEDIVKELCADGIDKNDLNRTVLNTLKTSRSLNFITNISLTQIPIRGYLVDLPDIFDGTANPKFFYPYLENALVSSNFIEIKPVELNSIVDFKNPYKKPSSEKYWRILNDNKMLIVPPSTITLTTDDKLTITYIKKPTPIIVATLNENQAIDGICVQTNCTLNDIIHRDIVYRAAKKAYAATQNATGYQIQSNEEKQ